LTGWTATVSGFASNEAIAKTIRHNCSRLAETSPPLAFKNAVGYGLFSRSDNSHYENEIQPVPACGRNSRHALQPTALFLRRGCKAVLAHGHQLKPH
jgi:hypothetical protein